MIRRPPRSTLLPYTTALPISAQTAARQRRVAMALEDEVAAPDAALLAAAAEHVGLDPVRRPERGQQRVRHRQLLDRKSTRLNSSHANISYAVFCLKKKNIRTRLLAPEPVGDGALDVVPQICHFILCMRDNPGALHFRRVSLVSLQSAVLVIVHSTD